MRAQEIPLLEKELRCRPDLRAAAAQHAPAAKGGKGGQAELKHEVGLWWGGVVGRARGCNYVRVVLGTLDAPSAAISSSHCCPSCAI
jgi:hypothetical protein